MVYKIIYCQMCGEALPDTTGKVGRPAMYCSKECRKLEWIFSMMEDLITGLKVTVEKKNQIKGRLFSLANLFNVK